MEPDHIFVEEFSLGDGALTVAVKDCIDIAGHRTCAGSGALADAAPAADHAEVVQHLLARGGRIVGKAAMHELAYGVTGINRWFGTPRNPLYPDLIPGGSSSGSAAAVAAGLAEVALGTDTGGSIRMPAACCGIFGLKPTYGRVSRKGCLPAESSLDCVGPFARGVAGIEVAMALIDPSFTHASVPGMARLGAVDAVADPEIVAAVQAYVARAAVDIVPVALPGMEEAFQAGMAIIAAESWAAYGAWIDDPRMGEDVRSRLLGARGISAGRLAGAEAVRMQFTAAVDEALAGVDALVLPTLPVVPPALTELADPSATLRLTALVRPFNLSGHPALTIPVMAPGGRPAGVQIVGRHGADEQLCAIARLLTQ